MSELTSKVNTLIRSRRAVFPKMYNGTPITDQEIRDILENANWAPTHKKTEPWRFVVFHGEGLTTLSEWMAQKYKKQAEQKGDFSEVRYQKFQQKPLQCNYVLGICLHRDPEERLPEWEEIAALACAVQNMWLTCAAFGIGCYWSTPSFVVDSPDFPAMQEGWQCKGLFYMGRWDVQELPAVRTPVEDKLVWVNS